MKASRIGKLPYWPPLLVVLLAIGAAVRLVNLNAPPLDFHSTRQLRNSLVARAIYYEMQPHTDRQKLALAESFQRAVGRYEPPISESIVAVSFLERRRVICAAAHLWDDLLAAGRPGAFRLCAADDIAGRGYDLAGVLLGAAICCAGQPVVPAGPADDLRIHNRAVLFVQVDGKPEP